jgi:hypothetical protein
MLGTNHMNGTTQAQKLRTVWSKELTRDFLSNLVFGNKVSRFDSDTPGARTIKIPTISQFSAPDKITQTQVTLQAPNETAVDLILDKHKHVAFIIEDGMNIQQNYQLFAEYTKMMTHALKRACDTDIANLVTGFSTASGTYNTALGTTGILAAVRGLDDADVPSEDRCWIYKPKTIADLRVVADYTRYDGTGYAGGVATGALGNGKAELGQGLVGMLYNAPVYQTTQVAQAGNNISNAYMHREALALGMQRNVRVQTDNKIEYLGTLVVGDIQYGVVERRDNAGIEVRS